MIYTDDILKESDDKALKVMEEAWNLSSEHYTEQFEDMKRWMRVYHLKLYDYGLTQQDIRSSEPQISEFPAVYYPVARAICDTTMAAIRGTIMPDEYEWLQPEPWNSDVGKEELAILQAFMRYRLDRINFGKKLERLVLQAMKCRWSVGLVDWRIKGGYVRLREPEEIEAIRILRKEGREGILNRIKQFLGKGDIDAGYAYDPYKINSSNFRVLNTLDTRPDWRGPDIDEDSQFFMFEEFVPWETLLRGEYSSKNPDGKYYNVSNLKAMQKDNRADSEPTEGEKFAADITKAPVEPQTLPDGLRVRYFITDNAMMMCDHEWKMVIGKRRLTEKPLVKLTYGKATDTFDQESAIQIMEPLQRQINYLVNMVQENKDRRIRKVIGINKDLLGDEVSIDLRPGNEIVEFYGDVRQALSSIDFPDVTVGWQEDVQFLLDAISRLVGMDVNTQSLYYAKHKPTATETDRVRDAMLTRLGRWESEIETDVISPAVGMMYSLEDAFFDEELMLAIFGSDATYYPVMTRHIFDVIGGNVKWRSRGTLYWQTKREELAFIQQAFQMALSAPPLQQGVDYMELFMEMLRKGGLRDPERFAINRPDREYTVNPHQEHRLIANGQKFPVGNLDDDQMHLSIHKPYLQQVEAGQISPVEFPPQNAIRLRWHIKEHEDRVASMQTTNVAGVAPNPMLPSGQTALPQLTAGTTTANLTNVQPIGV